MRPDPKTLEKEMKWLRDWYEKYDRKYFEGFFRNSDIKLEINPRLRTSCGRADCRGSIEVASYIFGNGWSREEIKDTLLHEMLHLFLYFNHEKGRRAWCDGSKVFKEWSKRLNCPPRGRGVEEFPKNVKVFLMCFKCGEMTVVHGKAKKLWCVHCGSDDFKVYKVKKHGRRQNN